MTDSGANIELIWDQLAKIFRNWQGMRPRKSWLTTGLSERARHNRVRILENGKQAKKLYDLTKNLTVDELAYLRTRADINVEQAQGAARLATVLNITVIIGFVVIFNQVFPGKIAAVFRDMFFNGSFPSILVGVLTIIGVILSVGFILAYSYGGVWQARDLKNLLDLSLSRRKVERTIVSAAQDRSDVSSDLRENFISDI